MAAPGAMSVVMDSDKHLAQADRVAAKAQRRS